MASNGIAKGTKTRYFQRVCFTVGARPPSTAPTVVENRREVTPAKKPKKTRTAKSSPKQQPSRSQSRQTYDDRVGDENRLHPNYIPEDPNDNDYEDVDDDYFEEPVIDPDPVDKTERQKKMQQKPKPKQKVEQNSKKKEPKKPPKKFGVKEKQNGKKNGKPSSKSSQRRVAGKKKGKSRPVWRNVGDPTRRAFVQKWSSDFRTEY